MALDETIVEEIGLAIITTLKRHNAFIDHIAGDLIRSVIAIVEPALAAADVTALLDRVRRLNAAKDLQRPPHKVP